MAEISVQTAQLQRQWLRDVLKDTGWRPSRLAKEAGVAKTTILRFLDAEADDPHVLRPDTVGKIASAAGVAPPTGSADVPGLPRRPARGLRDDGVPFRAADYPYGAEIDAAIRVLKGTRNAADGWVLKTSAIELEGYLPGDVVIVDLGRTPQAGDLVCAQVYDKAGKAIETAFRFYEPPYLVAASRDRALRKPLVVDNEHVVIMGVVTHRVSKVAA